MKLTCIVDACSYIYLEESDFSVMIGGKNYSLLKLLDEVVTIKSMTFKELNLTQNPFELISPSPLAFQSDALGRHEDSKGTT
jgi:hypothetical protein